MADPLPPSTGQEPALHIVLVEPEIPPNTGTIGRLCVATGSRLHLVKPLGFQLDDRALHRAGLDYWPHLDWRLWESFESLCQNACMTEAAGHVHPPRFFFLTTKARRPYWDQKFQAGDHLVFGRETRGLPESLLAANPSRCLTIPMHPAARSLNLAAATAIVLYEALRQITRASAA